MEKILETVSATKEYQVGESKILAVDQISLSVERGEFVCIFGRSGSGKSTLLNLLAGLEKPTSGQVIIQGQHLESMGEGQRNRFRREKIGFVFQSYDLLPQFSALENVALPLALRGTPPRQRKKEAAEMLQMVGLETHLNHKPSEMSGGQQQRVGIARAIITRPQIVFADEPTGNLDTKTGEEIMDLLSVIFRQWGTTFLLVSHDPDMKQYTQRSIHLQDGRLAEGE